MEFIKAVAETFYVESDEFELITSFILNNFNSIPNSGHILVIDNSPDNREELNIIHLRNDLVNGQIWILEVPSANMYFVRFTIVGELYMNGQLLHDNKIYPFNPGSSLRDPKSTPIYYSDIITRFRREELKESRVLYKVKDLEYRFKSGHTGIKKMSFEEESGRLVGIMGASGAGKSTLLNVLNGTNSPYKGEVLVNNVSI
ncbi:MAG: ATP-binding cassette domain-containing protein, partial [Bacteroidales bacterium]|nr:ATP-binding cassette domain-containing protein [Bacteroidales bacterium]